MVLQSVLFCSSLSVCQNIFFALLRRKGLGALDTFRKKLQNKGIQTLQDAWLAFFSSVQAKDIIALINKYPEFREYYSDIAAYRRKPKEVLHMYSEMIAFLDRNTVQYMVEDMTNQLTVLKQTNEELESQKKDLESQNKDLESQNKDWEEKSREWEVQKQNLEKEYERLLAENEELKRQQASEV